MEIIDSKEGTYDKFVFQFEDNTEYTLTLFDGDSNNVVIKDKNESIVDLVNLNDLILQKKVMMMLDKLEISNKIFNDSDKEELKYVDIPKLQKEEYDEELASLTKDELQKKLDQSIDANDFEMVKKLSKYLKESKNVVNFNTWIKIFEKK